MPLDYLAVWALTVANSLAILLVVRQLARLPKPRAPGPRVGAPFVNWTLATLAGEQRSSRNMPSEYTMLFAANDCRQCHTLFSDLAESKRTIGVLVVAADGDAAALAGPAEARTAQFYDEFLTGADQAFRQQFHIPGTPFAIAVRQGHVVGSGATRTPAELQRIADMLRPSAIQSS